MTKPWNFPWNKSLQGLANTAALCEWAQNLSSGPTASKGWPDLLCLKKFWRYDFRHVFCPQVLFIIILGMRSRKTPLDYAWLRSWKPVQMRVLEFILLRAKRPLISRFPLVAAFGEYSLVSCISLTMTVIKLAINITWWHFVKESFVNIIIFKVKIEETVQLLTHPSYFLYWLSWI